MWDLFQECRDDSVLGYPLISYSILIDFGGKKSFISIDTERTFKKMLPTHDKNNIHTHTHSGK